jgi:hypothetical protein
MESRRSSSTQATKQDEKQDENLANALDSSAQQYGVADLEKNAGSESSANQTGDSPDLYLVQWDDNEKANPRNWKSSYKAFMTLLLGMLAFAGSFGSSVILPGIGSIADEFNVSKEVTILCISLYVLGFALGPCL